MKKNNIIDKIDIRLKRAAIFARIGNKIISFIAMILILVMLLYGGYSLWSVVMMNTGAFVSNDLLKYKPSGPDTDNLTLKDLMKINKDVKGWITIDGTHIDYPIVQGESNDEYLNKDVFGEFALSGSIFLDYRNSPNFSDSYSLLYGHHMENGAMFGDIVEFLSKDYFEKHRTGTLYLSGATYKISLFGCVNIKEYDSIIYNPAGQNGENLNVLLNYIKSKSVQYRDIETNTNKLILGMSTCAEAGSNKRVVLFGQLDKEKPIKNGGNEQ